MPASSTNRRHLWTQLKKVTVPTSNCVIIVSAMSGCRSCTMRKQSAQLAQWAPSRFLWALLNTSPPTEKLKLASTLAMPGLRGNRGWCPSTSTRWRRVAVRKLLSNQGCTDLNQKFARVDSLFFFSKKTRTDSSRPPSTLTPCNGRSPFHTTASGFNRLALLCNSSTPIWCHIHGSKPGFCRGATRFLHALATPVPISQRLPQHGRVGTRHTRRPNMQRAIRSLATSLAQELGGMTGSPCSPPSPWWMCWVTPISSSHKYVDGVTETSHEGRI